MIQIDFDGAQVFLALYPANFSKAIDTEFSIITKEKITQNGAEKRTAYSRTLRTKINFQLWPKDERSAEFRVALQRVKNSDVLVPYWPGVHTDAWRTGIWLTAELDLSAWEVHKTDAPAGVFSAQAFRVPLMVGRFSKDAAQKAVGGRGVEAAIEFSDEGPAGYALRAASASGAVAGLALPSGFVPKIFPFAWDWTITPELTTTVDIERKPIGFGRRPAETFHDQPAVRAVNAAVTGVSPEELAALAAFFQERQGSVEPFWVQGPLAECILKTNTALNNAVLQVDNAAGLGDNRYIFLEATDGSKKELRKVMAVDTAANTLTLDRAPVSIHLAAKTRIVSAILARFRAPELKYTFTNQRLATAKLSLIETPHELVGPSGVKPCKAYLYRWSRRAGTIDLVSRHTSHEIPIDIGGEVFNPRPIEHKDLVHSLDPEEPVGTITAHDFDDNPLLLLKDNLIESTLWIQVLECFPDANGHAASAKVIGFGRVNKAPSEGETLTGEVGSIMTQLDHLVPTVTTKKQCVKRVYSEFCGVDKAAFTRTAAIAAHAGADVSLTGLSGAAVPANWFAGGQAEFGDGETYQSRTITASTASAGGALTITVNTPFDYAPIGQLSLRPTCNGSRDHCKNRFNNWPSALLFEWVPKSNPSLISRQTAEQGGGKK